MNLKFPQTSFSSIMDKSKTDNFSKGTAVIFANSYFILALISLGALVATFLVSNSDQTFQTKLLFFTAVILTYVLFCLLFYYRKRQKNRQREKEIPIGFGKKFDWSPDGKSFTFVNSDRIPNLWNYPLDDSSPQSVTDFNSGKILDFTWSNDGKILFIVRGVTNSDLVLIKDNAKV